MNKKFFMFLILALLFSRYSFCQVHLEWSANYRGPNDMDDEANKIAYDNYGNVYVCGTSRQNINSDAKTLLVKYSSVSNFQ